MEEGKPSRGWMTNQFQVVSYQSRTKCVSLESVGKVNSWYNVPAEDEIGSVFRHFGKERFCPHKPEVSGRLSWGQVQESG